MLGNSEQNTDFASRAYNLNIRKEMMDGHRQMGEYQGNKTILASAIGSGFNMAPNN